MSDLIERLRYLAGTSSQQLDQNVLLLKEAADRIKVLEDERNVLLKLLGEELGEAHSWGRALSDVEIKLVSKAIAAADGSK